MEKQNTYLSEGQFEYETFERDSSREDAYNSFKIFTKNCKLKFGSEIVNAFEYETIKRLIDKLYSSIDKIDRENNVQNEMLVVNSSDAIEILTLQRDFINNLFHYYTIFYEERKNKIFEKSDRIDGFVNYMPISKLSSGENALLNLFSRLYDFLNSKLSNETRLLKDTKNYILLLDEADLGFHPTWKKKFVSSLISTIPHFFNSLENNPNVQILFSTHDPLTLSDIPNKNIIYLNRNITNEETEILDLDNPKRPKKSFAANVTELLADSFFIEDGLIGDFANKKINETIFWLNEKENKAVYEYHKKLIQNIDEPIIQRKLAEMYSEKMKKNLSEELLQKEIDILTERLKKMKRK
jgi:predicted ATP-binding protein involved in virulence